MILKKLATLVIIFIFFTGSGASYADDSMRDMATVFGIGAVGAVLGLSTLSFVDKPTDHLKNISVGGAIGVIIGVGVVVFSQASRSTLSNYAMPVNSQNFASYEREDFKLQRVAKEYLKEPSFNYSIKF